MGTRPIGTGQDERAIPELRGTLENWRYLMGQRGWGSRDAPWWYNERASLSLLAGALWYADGWAFEEFVTSKRHKRKARRGRGDLMFEVGGLKAVAEAKQCWPALRTTPRSAMSVIARALDRACEESTRQRLPCSNLNTRRRPR
jgi:hypothetical protein